MGVDYIAGDGEHSLEAGKWLAELGSQQRSARPIPTAQAAHCRAKVAKTPGRTPVARGNGDTAALRMPHPVGSHGGPSTRK